MPHDEFSDDPFSQRADRLLHDLQDQTEQQLDPLPPSQIRALGERRRTRRRTGIAAGALAVAAVAAGSVMSLDLHHSSQRVDAAGTSSPSASSRPAPSLATATASETATSAPSMTASDPSAPADSASAAVPGPSATDQATESSSPSAPASATTSATASASTSPSGSADASPTPTNQADPSGSTVLPGAVSVTSLPDTGLVYWKTPGDLTEQSSSGTGLDESGQFSACEGDVASLGARNLVTRFFGGSPAGSGSVNAKVAVMDFTSTAQVTAARQKIRQWYFTCSKTLAAAGYTKTQVGSPVDVPLGADATAVDPHQASFRTIRMTNPGPDVTSYEDATLIQVGNRLEWVVYQVINDTDPWSASTSSGSGLPLYPGIERAPQLASRLMK